MCIFRSLEKYISGWPGTREVGWTNIARQNRGLSTMHAAEITVNRGWPHFAENLVHQVGEHTAPAAFSSSIFSRPSFCKFFGKAANILPQIKHERPPSSCVAAVHRLWEETAGWPCLCLCLGVLVLCLSVFNVLVLVLCVFNVVLSVRGCSKTRRGLEAFGGKVRSEKMRQVASGDHMC